MSARPLGKGEPSLGSIDAKLVGGIVDCLDGPAIERGIFTTLRASFRRSVSSGVLHQPLIGRSDRFALVRLRFFSRTRTSATTIIAAPVQSRGVKASP